MEAQTLKEMLRYATHNGVYHLPVSGRAAMAQAATDADLCHYVCALGDTTDADDALARIGLALQFPQWYGGNFDALYDCLTDLSWQEVGGTVIVLTGCDALKANSADAWETLLGVFASAAEYWQNEETPFWVFVDIHSDGLAYLPTIA